MAKIKTKDAVSETIRTIDKSANMAVRMKTAYISTKDKAEQSVNAAEHNPEEYASDRVENTIDRGTHEAVYQLDKAGRKGVQTTKENIVKAKDKVQEFKQKRATESIRKQTGHTTRSAQKSSIRTAGQTEKTIKQSVTSSGKKTIKTAKKATTKTAKKSVKTAERTAKTAIKTTKQTAQATAKTAQATAKAAQRAAQVSKATAKAVATGIKAAIKATIATVKAAIAGIKALVAAIAAGGWIAVLIIILLCLVGAVSSSYYGIFFSSETSDTGLNITDVICEINNDYDNKIEGIKTKSIYDEIEITGSKANWKDILSVYSVMVATDKDIPMDTATIDKTKKSILSNIFWDMNSIDSITETRIKSEEVKTSDKYSNETISIKKIAYKVLTISITSKTADDMTTLYSFNDTQKSYIKELMSDKNDKLWTSLIYNVGRNDSNIDISYIDFNNESANDTQKKILSVAVNSKKYGISARSGYCQAWVADVYQAVTGSRGSAHCALCAAEVWTVSQNFSKIQVGATVYGYSNNPYGHVGIYIGNGKVIHNLSGTVKVQSLESWINDFKGFAWGWENGNNLTSDSQYNCIR